MARTVITTLRSDQDVIVAFDKHDHIVSRLINHALIIIERMINTWNDDLGDENDDLTEEVPDWCRSSLITQLRHARSRTRD